MKIDDDDLTLGNEPNYENETDLLPTEDEIDIRCDYRELARNHSDEDSDTEPVGFFSWSRSPYTDTSEFERKSRERNPE